MPKARITKLVTRGLTRAIPRIVDSSDRRAARRVAIQQNPRTSPTRDAFGPRPSAPAVFGSKVSGGARTKAGTYSPPSVNDNI